MAENKIQFGLKNVYYAVLGSTGTYATPVAIPGAVNLSLEAEGEMTKWYADNALYFTADNNQGYSGDLEVARFPDQMLQDIWGYTLGTTSKVLTESTADNAVQFALLYQIDGDAANQCYVLYNCTATRPNIGSATKEDTTEVQTQTCSITASPTSAGKVCARTTADTPEATKSTWFTTVFVES